MRGAFLASARHGGGASTGGGDLSDVPGPAGSASFTADFGVMNGVDGVVVYYDDSDNDSIYPADWPYREVSAGNGQSSVPVGNLAAGPYWWKAAGYTGSTVGDLGLKVQETAA